MRLAGGINQEQPNEPRMLRLALRLKLPAFLLTAPMAEKILDTESLRISPSYSPERRDRRRRALARKAYKNYTSAQAMARLRTGRECRMEQEELARKISTSEDARELFVSEKRIWIIAQVSLAHQIKTSRHAVEALISGHVCRADRFIGMESPQKILAERIDNPTDAREALASGRIVEWEVVGLLLNRIPESGDSSSDTLQRLRRAGLGDIIPRLMEANTVRIGEMEIGRDRPTNRPLVVHSPSLIGP